MPKRRKTDVFKPPAEMTVDESLRGLLASTGEFAYVWDISSDKIQWVNQAPDSSSFIFSVKTGTKFNDLLAREDRQIRRDKLNQTLNESGAVELGYQVLSEEGHTHFIKERATAVISQEGQLEKIIGSIRLVEDSPLEATWPDQTDRLTGLYNENKIRQVLDKCDGRKGIYIIIGIDKLSIINDVYGPGIAEEVVIGIGKLLKKCVRNQDVLGRVNTDHFGLVIEDCDEEGQTLILENLLNTIRQTSLETSKGSLKITVSIGAARFPEDARTTQDILIRTESALNEAKHGGRNCYKRFSFSKNSQAVQERTIEIADLVRYAIDHDTFEYAYQPVVCSFTQEIKFYEMLLRLKGADQRTIRAQEFIKVAEQLGLTKQIDILVLKHALSVLEAHPNLHLSINISAFNASDGEWLQTLLACVYSREEIAKRLIIEITETAALNDEKEAEKFVRMAHSLGCRVALDDFGEGYIGFKQLKGLPVDIVKIDGSFIEGIANNTGKQLFIRTLLELAEGYHMTIVGEGIEAREEYEILRSFGLHLQQGYYFGRPAILDPARLDAHFSQKINHPNPA